MMKDKKDWVILALVTAGLVIILHMNHRVEHLEKRVERGKVARVLMQYVLKRTIQEMRRRCHRKARMERTSR